jgi:hypothetical protein
MDKIMTAINLELFFGKVENQQAEHPEDTEYPLLKLEKCASSIHKN